MPSTAYLMVRSTEGASRTTHGTHGKTLFPICRRFLHARLRGDDGTVLASFISFESGTKSAGWPVGADLDLSPWPDLIRPPTSFPTGTAPQTGEARGRPGAGGGGAGG